MEIAVSNKEKTDIMVKAFANIHSSENLSEEGRRRRERILNRYSGVLDRREETDDITDEPFTLAGLMRTISRFIPTSLGKDQVCYVILKHLEK